MDYSQKKERLEELRTQIENESFQEKIKFPKVKIFPIDISGIQGALKIKELFENEKSKGDFKINVLVNNAVFGTHDDSSARHKVGKVIFLPAGYFAAEYYHFASTIPYLEQW